MKKVAKSFISLLLTISMCFSLLPSTLFATTEQDLETQITGEQTGSDNVEQSLGELIVSAENGQSDNNSTNLETSDLITPDEDVEVTYFDVVFMDGEETLVSQIVKEGDTPVLPDDPYRVGHDFKGWTPDVTAPVTADTVYTAVFEAVDSCTVIIKYVDGEGNELFDSVIRSYIKGEEINETVVSPEDGKYVTEQTTVTYTDADITGSETIFTVVYTPISVQYTVNHCFELLDGTEYIHSVEMGGNVIDDVIYVEPLDIDERPEGYTEGFHHDSTRDSAPLDLENANGVTLEVHYLRDVNSIIFETLGGEAIAAVSDKFGTEVTMPVPSRVGYTFHDWHTSTECKAEYVITCKAEDCKHETLACKELEETCYCNSLKSGDKITIPAVENTVYYACWAPEKVTYTVVYMIEKQNLGFEPTADSYSSNDFVSSDITFTREALVDSEVTAIDEDITYQGMTAFAVHGDTNMYAKDVRIASYMATETVKVNPDGSTVLNIYFKRDHFTLVFDGYNSFKRTNGDHLGADEVVHLYFKYNFEPIGIKGSYESTSDGNYYSEIIIENLHYGETFTDRWPDNLAGSFYLKDNSGNFVELDKAAANADGLSEFDHLYLSQGETSGSFTFDGWRGVMNSDSETENFINTIGRNGQKLTGRTLCNFNRDGEPLINKWRGCLMVEQFHCEMYALVEKVIIPEDAPKNTTGAPIEIPKDEYTVYSELSKNNNSKLFNNAKGSFDPNVNYWVRIPNSGSDWLPNNYGWWAGKITGFEYDHTETGKHYPIYYSNGGYHITACTYPFLNPGEQGFANGHNPAKCGYPAAIVDAKERELADDEGNTRLMPFLYKRLDYTLKFIPEFSTEHIQGLNVSYEVPYEADLSWWEVVPNEEQATVVINGITYEFDAWYYDEEFKRPVDWENDRMPAEGFSVYGNWEPVGVTLTFDLNYEGSDGPFVYNMDTNSYMKDQEGYSNIADPKRDGYRFLGWYTKATDPSDNDFFNEDDAIGKNWDGSTLYAAWELLETKYTVRYLKSGTNSILYATKVVEGVEIGISVTEEYVKIQGYYPDKLEATIESTDANVKNNTITFYYTKLNSVEYQVIHRLHHANGEVEVIEEDVKSTSAERVVAYSGTSSSVTIPEGFYATKTIQSRVLTSNPDNNKIYFDYYEYPIAKYVVHHFYQSDVNTVYTQYPEKESALQKATLRKGSSFVALRKIEDEYEIEKIFIEDTEKATKRNPTFTATEADMGKEIHIYMYYRLINKTSITVSKTWNDANNQDGIRPNEIKISLYADGERVVDQTVKPDDDGNWNYTFYDLPKYASPKNPIKYTFSEEHVGGYTSKIEGFNITNTHVPEKVSFEGSKTWNDADDQDGKRPKKITINLLADGKVVDTKTVTAADGWIWSFTDLPKFRDGGIEIVYTITEEEFAEYTSEIDGFNVTNTHVAEKVCFAGKKTWNDADDQDGIRPENITINLLANDKIVETVVVTEADAWAWEFVDLDKYANGEEIVYTITEEEVAEYTTEIEGFNVINTHIPEKVSFAGSKTWKDANNQDGIRPRSININLLANGEVVDVRKVTAADGWAWTFENLDKYANGEEIVYTITEDAVSGYTTVIDGFNVTNSHTPETIDVSGSKTWNDADNQDGKRPSAITVNLHADGVKVDSKVVTEVNGWKWTFSDLDKYSAGTEIVYTVSEDAVEGYTASINGTDIVNTYAPEKTNVMGHKIWNDNNDQDGIRPESIKINLYANGSYVASKVVSAADNWTWNFENLDKYANGTEIVYTITEDAVNGYIATVVGYNVTNTHVPEKTEVKGIKIWNDADNLAGKRPESIVINLFANGIKVDSRVVTSENSWAWSFTGLEKYENGKLIVYTISEETVHGYTTEVLGYNVVNNYIPEVISVNVTKVWYDDDNFDGMRPESITVHLYADGVAVDTKVISEADGWSWTFEGLNKYNDDKLIVYSVVEESVPYYATYISATEDGGFIIANEYLYEIEEEDVPLQAPETSDFGLSAIIFALASLGVACGTFFTRKKK